MGRRQSDGESGASWFGDDDPWVIGTLDDAFVNAATIVERSAEERLAELRQLALQVRTVVIEDDTDDDAWRDSVRRRHRVRRIVGLLVVVLLFVGAGARVWLSLTSGGSSPPLQLGDVAGARNWTETALPTAPSDPSSTPLGRPATPPSTQGTYRFVSTQANGVSPVAYDPCRPIHYVVSQRTAPAGATDIVQSAIAELSRATGLKFIDDGVTDEPPSSNRAAFQPERYGDRWAPVLIAWTDATEVDDLDGDVVGSAGSVQLRRTGTTADGAPRGEQLFVTSSVSLDGPDLEQSLDGSAEGSQLVRAVVLHELGHLVGLDHVRDRGELMFPTANDVVGYGPGDLQGLAALGRGACFSDV